MGVCNCSMFCCTLLYVHSSIAIILMGKRELIALLNLSSWCLVMVERLFLAMPGGCLQFVIVVFPDHTHLLFSVACVSLCLLNIVAMLTCLWSGPPWFNCWISLYPPQTLFVGGILFSRCPSVRASVCPCVRVSVRPSVRNALFP